MLINATFFTGLLDKDCDTFEVPEEEMREAFANALKELRKYNNYTLKQVSNGTEIPLQTIARYENGENTPSVVQAFKLAYFFNIDIQDMFLLGYIDENRRERFLSERYKPNN